MHFVEGNEPGCEAGFHEFGFFDVTEGLEPDWDDVIQSQGGVQQSAVLRGFEGVGSSRPFVHLFDGVHIWIDVCHVHAGLVSESFRLVQHVADDGAV